MRGGEVAVGLALKLAAARQLRFDCQHVQLLNHDSLDVPDGKKGSNLLITKPWRNLGLLLPDYAQVRAARDPSAQQKAPSRGLSVVFGSVGASHIPRTGSALGTAWPK